MWSQHFQVKWFGCTAEVSGGDRFSLLIIWYNYGHRQCMVPVCTLANSRGVTVQTAYGTPSIPVPDGTLHHVPGEGGRGRHGLAYLEDVPGRPHGVAGRRERVSGCLPRALSIPREMAMSQGMKLDPVLKFTFRRDSEYFYFLDTAPVTTLEVAASDLFSAASTASITLSATARQP
jgi:hypothetical protein